MQKVMVGNLEKLDMFELVWFCPNTKMILKMLNNIDSVHQIFIIYLKLFSINPENKGI